VRTASMAVLPPPMTATRLPRIAGVSVAGNRYAFIRFERVRYSLAEYTPIRLMPGIRGKDGRPAPVPMKTASKPSSVNSSSTVNVWPITWFVLISTPRRRRPSISRSTIDLGRRNSGMPYTSTPPALWRASKMVTWCPSFARSAATVRPAGPDPTTATRWPVGGCGGVSSVNFTRFA